MNQILKEQVTLNLPDSKHRKDAKFQASSSNIITTFYDLKVVTIGFILCLIMDKKFEQKFVISIDIFQLVILGELFSRYFMLF